MKVSEYLFGTEEEIQAEETVEALEKKKALSKNAQHKLKDAQVKARQLMLRKLRTFGVASIIGGTGIGLWVLNNPENEDTAPAVSSAHNEKSANPVPKSPVPKSTKSIQKVVPSNLKTSEEAAQKKIEDVEAGFARFKQKLFGHFKDAPDPVLEKWFDIPFDLVQQNSKGKDRNILILERKNNLKGKTYTYDHYMGRFYYGFKDANYLKSAASFSPSNREMKLATDFDPSSDVHCLILFHELFHAYYDSKIRAGIKDKAGWEFYKRTYLYQKGKQPPFDLLNEAYATVYELKALNLLLDGQLEQSVRNGIPINNSAVMSKLGADKMSEIGPLNHTLALADSFYRDGEKYQDYPRAFLDRIARVAKQQGYRVWVQQENGIIVSY